MSDRYVDINRVLDFVDRTVGHGTPLRVAVARAERRFAVPRALIRSFHRGRLR